MVIIRAIEQLLTDDDHDILLIFAPPGSAKSHYVSVALPSWYVASNPKCSVIAASHSVELAQKWGRRVRNLIVDNGSTLGVQLAADSQAVGRWATSQGGEYLAAGVGSGIAGFRADLAVVDDPYGSKEDAYSQAVRDTAWDWFTHDLSSRLKPGGKRIVMHTRMHVDDLAGRIIAEGKKGKFRVKVLSIPAIAGPDDPVGREPGEYLWDEPGGYNYGAYLRARQREAPANEWASLYQQQPFIEGGNIFRLSDWQLFKGNKIIIDGKEHEQFPKCDFTVAALDTAYTEKQENDASALVVMGAYQGPGGEPRAMLLNAWEKRLPIHGPDDRQKPGESYKDWVQRTSSSWGVVEWVAYSCRRHGVNVLLVEAKAAGIPIATELKRLYSREAWVVQYCDPRGRDKTARAHSVQYLFADKRIYAPDRPYADLVKSQAAAFPKGAFDDAVDSMMYCLEYLRDRGWLQRVEAHEADLRDAMMHKPELKPIYDV